MLTQRDIEILEKPSLFTEITSLKDARKKRQEVKTGVIDFYDNRLRSIQLESDQYLSNLRMNARLAVQRIKLQADISFPDGSGRFVWREDQIAIITRNLHTSSLSNIKETIKRKKEIRSERDEKLRNIESQYNKAIGSLSKTSSVTQRFLHSVIISLSS